MKGALVLLFLLLAGILEAQPLQVDKATPAWSTHRDAANVASNVALWSTVGIEAIHSWRAEDRGRAFLEQGLSAGISLAGAGLFKLAIRRDRPCAPACGAERPDASFLSGHTALAFSSGCRLGLTLPIAGGTGYLRIASAKHWLTDVLAGAALGCGSDQVARRIVR